MSFRARDRKKPYRPRTPAQIEQVRVLRIRGLWYHSYTLTGWRAQVMRLLCDHELAARGLETQTARCGRQRAELDARLAAEQLDRDLADNIPF